MKLLLATLLLFPAESYSQVLKSSVIDFDTKEPLVVLIEIVGTSTSVIPDSNGYFKIELNGSKTILFHYLGYPSHKMEIENSSDTIEIEKIELVYLGFEGYVSSFKKVPFSKKKKLVCRYVNTKKERSQKYFSIKSKSGTELYIWERINDEMLTTKWTP